MQYFTKELLWRINDTDENVRTQAEREWGENSLIYQEQFRKTKKHLSKNFINIFLSRNGLHDYIINNISLEKERTNYLCVLKVTNSEETLLITMDELNAAQIDVRSFQYCIQGNLVWGYHEFAITHTGHIQLSILCDTINELCFQFKKINIRVEK